MFSHFYDLIIQLHSKDESSALRDFLIKKTGIGPGDRVLDICTGTGAVVMVGHKVIVPKDFVVGLDFSYGMLSKAREKAKKRGFRLFIWSWEMWVKCRLKGMSLNVSLVLIPCMN